MSNSPDNFLNRNYYADAEKDKDYCCSDVLTKIDEEENEICILENSPEFRKKLDNGLKAIRKLKIVMCVCFFFMCVTIYGGIMSGSLAILTDAAHMSADVTGYGISIVGIIVS